MVWVDAWQQQCCGDEFKVGSVVRWTVGRHVGAQWISETLGPEWDDRVSFSEERHFDQIDRELYGELCGTVSTITVVTTGHVKVPLDPDNPEGGAEYRPIPGSQRLRPVQEADPWEPDPPMSAGWSFDGWIVELSDATYQAGVQSAS